MNQENKTESLKHDIYVNENGTIYISEDDVKNLFDATIYYDEKYNQIITTSDTKVANIVINQNQMIINNSTVNMLDSIIKINDNIYLPVSDMAIVYNINISYIKSSNRVIIDELNKGMIKATVSDKTDIKFKPRGLSKSIGEVNEGEIVSCFYTTSKGWRQIRTSDGIIGYVKANKLSDEYILRQDMKERQKAVKISLEDYKKGTFKVDTDMGIKDICVKNIFDISGNNIKDKENFYQLGEEDKIWASISNKTLKEQTNNLLQDYKLRTKLIDSILDKIVKNNLNGINIEFEGIKDEETMKRFIIELAPKLREIGVTTSIVLSEKMQEKDYIDIVDYIVE